MNLFILILACIAVVSASAVPRPRRGPPPPLATTAAPTTTTTTAGSAEGDDDEYTEAVKALIDAGSCPSVVTGSNCGDDAVGYYNEFVYNAERVIISSGAPDHEAEHDAENANPNVRCERWQFITVPVSPSLSSGYDDWDLGAVGLLISGGAVYDHRSAPDGSLAAYYEWDSLDSCYGHSDADKQYHYHANPGYCISGSEDSDQCLFLGYMLDGVPIYGYCSDLTSCYELDDGEDGDNIADYTYTASDTCQLDEVNGYTFSDGSYGYVMTPNFSYVPIGRKGTTVATRCGLE